MNYPITLHRDRYPSPHCAHAWICSWYLLLVYTRSNSNPTAVPCAGNITLFAHKEHNHGFPDFSVQQYSYFVFSTRIFFFSCDLSGIPHYLYIPGILYRTYWNTTMYTHLVHIQVYLVYTYSSIILYVVPWYHTTYDIYHQIFCVRQTYSW